MRKIILLDWQGYFVIKRIEKKHIIEKYYIGHTVNGIPKYKWNFWMWLMTRFTKEPEK